MPLLCLLQAHLISNSIGLSSCPLQAGRPGIHFVIDQKLFDMNPIMNLGKGIFLVLALLTLPLNTIHSQCFLENGTYYTAPCDTNLADFLQPDTSDIGNCPNIVSVEANLPFQTIMNGCDSACFSLLIRQWRVNFSSGPDTLLVDTICFTPISLEEVFCPRDTVVYCNGGLADTSVAALGSPLHNNGIPCNILVNGPTQILWSSTSLGCLKFTRQWLVMDWCTLEIDTCRQTIEVRDTTDPSISVIPLLQDFSTSGDACTGSVIFPVATVSDNCAAPGQISVKIEVAGQTLNSNGGIVHNVPQGTHQAVYIATDGCGNSSTDTTVVSVIDKVGPIAICKSAKSIQLSQTGILVMPATAFDNGSFDLCDPEITVKVKRIPSSSFCAMPYNQVHKFDDMVKFCCMDANKDIMVIVRVYQGFIPAGPISIDAFSNPYTECMVMVRVLDKVGPVISCPADTTIDCRDIHKKRVRSLTDYGTPVVSDLCLDTVWIDSLPQLGVCNTGVIIRRINARDDAGNVSTCSQKIFVINTDPFDGKDTADIAWPKDTTFFVCSANTSPANTGFPVIKDASCSQIVFGSQDEVFQYVPNACRKILRRWTATDWCQLSPTDSKAGKWYYTQKIIVMDTLKPVITVPDTVTVNSMDSICGAVQVLVPLPSATDCTDSASLIWSFITDINGDGIHDGQGYGKDASQTLPVGKHKIIFSVNDHCGNTCSDTTVVIVRDAKAPTPLVMHGLATDLSLMNGVVMARVPASLFFVPGSAVDNCTPSDKLIFSFSPDTSDRFRIFTCDSLGMRTVYLYVTDEAGNQGEVISYILIQDNFGSCPGAASGIKTTGVGGKIQTEWGSHVEQVDIKLMHGQTVMQGVNMNQGQYKANGLQIGQSYEIIPKKNVNPYNGVSTLDLILIQKHILGLQPIRSPYKQIAADIDKNGEINGIDLVELRKLILGIDKAFTKNEAWRFIDAGYRFQEKADPLKQPFREQYLIRDLQSPMQVDFIGVKIGDINESSIPSELLNLESREATPALAFHAIDQTYSSGDLVRLEFFGAEQTSINGFQLSLHAADLDLLSVEPGLIPAGPEYVHLEGHTLKMSYHQSNALRPTVGMELFTLVFRARNDGRLSRAVNLGSEPWLHAEVYDGALKASPLKLDWKGKANQSFNMQLGQNRPNPFFESTVIEYQLPESSPVTLKVMDLRGRTLLLRQESGTRGHNSITLSRKDLGTGGMYYYTVESVYGTLTRKMILAD